MDDIGPGLIGSEVVGDAKSTVLMPVPVDLDVAALHTSVWYHLVLDK